MTPSPSDVPQHVDLYFHEYDGEKITTVFECRLAVDSPELVHPDGTPTQLGMGSASYYSVSEPHTLADCEHGTGE